MEENIKKLIINYLSYQDATVAKENKDAMLSKSLTTESSQKYAISLNELFQVYGEEKVDQLATSLHIDFQNKIKFFEILSHYGKTLSWVYWDIAKQ